MFYVSDISSKLARLQPLYPYLEDQIAADKRGSLLRFGKRRSLFRFGKRSSILRFGKRPDLVGVEESVGSPLVPSEYFTLQEDPRMESSFVFPAEKKGSIFRFGKKSIDTDNLYERHSKEKKPHTPWRFGRQEDYMDETGFPLGKE